MRKGSVLIPILAMIFAVLAAGTVIYFGFVNPPGKNANTNSVSNTNTVTNTGVTTNTNSSVNSNSSTNTTVDVTVGWKTYTNSAIGYSVKYPLGWTVTETNQTDNAITHKPVQFITLENTSTKNILTLGVRKSTDTFTMSSRTGFGAGDEKTGDTVSIAGANIITSQLVYQGKVKTISFFPTGSSMATIGSYQVEAFMDYNGSNTYDSVDLINSPDYAIKKNILGSLTFISPTADWKTYTNTRFSGSSQGYQLKYPNDWRVSDFDPQYVRVVPPNGDNTNRETASPDMTIDFIVVPGTIPVKKIDSPVDVTIGGKSAQQGVISGIPDVFATQITVDDGILQVSWTKVNEFESTQKLMLSTFTFTK